MFQNVKNLITLKLKVHFDCLSCTQLLLVLVLTVQDSDEASFEVTDSSKSLFCKHGLLAGKDVVDMEVKADMEDVDITDSTTVSIEAVDPLDNFSIPFCSIHLNFACANPANEGCVCKKVEGKMYTLRYLSLANAMYSGNLIKINEANIGVKFPTIQKDVPVVVSLRVNGENVKGAADCQISLPAKSTASFAVCAEGVTAPELNLTYGGKVKTSKGENCLEANICTQSATETVYYSVHNSCHQDTFFSCSVQVHDVPETGENQGTAGENQGTAGDNQGTAAPSSQGTTATENQGTKHQSTKPSHTEDDSGTDSGFLIKFIILVIVLLILTVLAVQLYKVNVTQSPRESSDADVGVSSPVDVLPKTSSISSLRRLTQRFSVRSVSHQKILPPVVMLDLGTEV